MPINIDPKLVYPLGSAILLLSVFPLYLYRKDLRKFFLLVIFGTLPFAIVSEYMYFQDYWFPPDFSNFSLLGIRITYGDILFGVASPLLTVFLYPFLFRKTANKEAKINNELIFKYIGLMFITTAGWVLLTIITGINSIYTSSIGQLFAVLIIIARRLDLISVALKSFLVCGIGAFAFYYIFQLFIGSEYLEQVWLLDSESHGFEIGSVTVPLTEVLFASSMGAFFSIVLPFIGKFKYTDWKENLFKVF